MKNGTFYIFNGANSKFQKNDEPIRDLLAGEILVGIAYATICGSDIHTFCGIREEATPSILGHEIVGKVLSLNSEGANLDALGKTISIGDRITWTVYASDPNTNVYNPDVPQKNQDLYKYGHRRLTDGDDFNGGLATHIILRPHTVVRVLPDDLPLQVAATINCAIATAAGAIRLAGESCGKRVVISGMGLLGLTIVSMFKEAGANEIIVSDVQPERLKLAKAFAADVTINTNDVSLQEYMESQCKTADIYVDMSGVPEAMEQGIAALGVNGRAVLVGAVFKQHKISLDAENIIRKLITIRGLHNYNYEDFNFAVDFMVNQWKNYPFQDLIEKEFHFDEVDIAFEFAVSNKPIRVGINQNLS
ncbi:zinc-binding dehydrogenase [Sphingobacterium deserti]|uniref:alcohol dehydrogenase n=1 Tax=Sphingobacterium deserti TaxID=1229276 RepID=A0A0B8T5A4_9SPHI|nr:zinc-binding dehydrogenase [Sphingobacterium deserti]KGE12699.1 alcohol dehydrogenase, zinc-containing [Sphingobacterium deserti]